MGPQTIYDDALTPPGMAHTYLEKLKEKQSYEELSQIREKSPKDVLLHYGPLDKLGHNIKTIFVTTPKTWWKGLKGDPTYTFSDMMLMSKVPYYLGGVFLTLSPLLGGNKLEAIRQGTAMMMYLGGITSAHSVINGLYKARYGIDLGMRYQSSKGPVDWVYASSEFPRFDLLTQADYDKMAAKMGIPDTVNEKDGAVREKARAIINNSRALKLIVGNLASAIGAGYLARSDKWYDLPKCKDEVLSVMRSSQLSHGQKWRTSAKVVGQLLSSVIEERLNMTHAPAWKPAIVYGLLATMAGSVAYILFHSLTNKEYVVNRPQSSFLPWNPVTWGVPFAATQSPQQPRVGGGV